MATARTRRTCSSRCCAPGHRREFLLLNRGSATDVNFPSWQFNHAICFVPRAPEAGQPDDLWLDSTDSVTPFGFVPPGDYGRRGWCSTGQGGLQDRGQWQGHGVGGSRRLGTHPGRAGGWRGNFHRAATGLADDGFRRAFRGLTPVQRGARLYGMLTGLWPSGDFTQGAVSDVSELRDGVELRAEVAATGGDLPRLESSGRRCSARPRATGRFGSTMGNPVAHADGATAVRGPGDVPPPLPAPKQSEVGGQKMSVAWERMDERTVRRLARLELLQPVVPAADYAALRQALRNGTRAARWPTFPLFLPDRMTTADNALPLLPHPRRYRGRC